MSITFDNCISLFPTSKKPIKNVNDNICFYNLENELFVPPSLTLVDGVEPTNAQLYLFSAPAAVGKSTFSKSLASKINALYWDLSKFQVGNGSLKGIPTEIFDFDCAASIFNHLRSGDLVFVLDSLDETALKSGESNFHEFIAELLFELKRNPKSRALLFSRIETAEEILLKIDEAKTAYTHLRINYFTEAEAVLFIQKQVSKKIDNNNWGYYRKACLELFNHIYAIAGAEKDRWEDINIRRFLGYSPVLEALSEYLSLADNIVSLEQELVKTRNEFQSAAFGAQSYLQKVIFNILEREQGKVITNLKEVLEPIANKVGWSNWQSLYSTDEQLIRLADKILHSPSNYINQGLPKEISDIYEKAIYDFTFEHPFLDSGSAFSNIVFRDFFYAWALRSQYQTISSAVLTRLADIKELPSPLFAWFYLSWIHVNSKNVTINSEHFAPIYNSILSSSNGSGTIKLAIYERDQSTLSEVTVGMIQDGRFRTFTEYSFEITNCDSLAFDRRVEYATIALPKIIELGNKDDFILGPNVFIECDELWFSAKRYYIRTKDSDIYLKANSSECVTSTINIDKDDQLTIDSDNLTYPFDKFKGTVDFERIEQADLTEPFKHLRSICSWFKRDNYADIARYKDLVENAAIKQIPLAVSLRNYLLEKGILSESGRLYRFHEKEAAKYGINYNDVMHYRLNDALSTFLQNFLAWNA